MAAAPQTGMDKQDMRKMLVHTKEKPVHCAIGVGKDQSLGLLVMDKLKQPKMLEKQLIDSLPDAKNTRWGTATVDWDDDPKLVKLYLNKPVTGMARRLVKTLKGTGFSKVRIMMEDGTEVEGAAGEEDEDTAAAGPQQEAGPAAPIAPEAGPQAAPPPPPPAPPPPAAGEQPAADAEALKRQLAALIARVQQVEDAGRKAELAKIAAQANVNIKTNNLTYASAFVRQLETALGQPGAAAPAATAQAPDLEALRKLWARLTLAIPKAAEGNEAEAARWSALSGTAGKALDAGDAAAAGPAVEALREAMAEAIKKMQEKAKLAGTYDKSGQIWAAVRKKVEDELTKLRGSIVTSYKGEPFLGEIQAKFDERTAPVLASFDLRLADKMTEISKAADASRRSKLVDEAHTLIDGYEAAAANPLLADLDANPFVPLSLQSTVTSALAQLSKAIG